MIKKLVRKIQYLWDSWKHNKNDFIMEEFDRRDYKFKPSGTSNPSFIDMRNFFLKSRNQEWTNACTGFAAAYMLEYLLNKEFETERRVSPLYIWYYGKTYHGWEDKNKGVWLRYTLKAIFDNGFVKESTFPFQPSYLREPSKFEIETLATKFLIKEFYAYYTLSPTQIKDALSKKRPVVFGITLNDSFFGNRDGKIEDTTPGNNSHAMLAVGYTDDNYIIAKNSWGIRWGDKGYCFIPYNYFVNNTHNLWTIDLKAGRR